MSGNSPVFQIRKRLGPFSVCHRNFRALSSHCRFLHGYGRTVEVVLQATELDDRGWVYDFGQFKVLRAILESSWDHKVQISKEDPLLPAFRQLDRREVIQLEVVDDRYTGMEGQALWVYEQMKSLLQAQFLQDRVTVTSVEVKETDLSSAIYTPSHKEKT